VVGGNHCLKHKNRTAFLGNNSPQHILHSRFLPLIFIPFSDPFLILCLFSLKEERLTYDITSLSVQMANFHEIQQGCHAIEGELDSIIHNLVISTVTKWRTFELLRWTQNMHQSKWGHEWLSLETMETSPFLCDG
jgi:hypothetical protein